MITKLLDWALDDCNLFVCLLVFGSAAACAGFVCTSPFIFTVLMLDAFPSTTVMQAMAGMLAGCFLIGAGVGLSMR